VAVVTAAIVAATLTAEAPPKADLMAPMSPPKSSARATRRRVPCGTVRFFASVRRARKRSVSTAAWLSRIRSPISLYDIPCHSRRRIALR
jgi:hypothetical protein